MLRSTLRFKMPAELFPTSAEYHGTDYDYNHWDRLGKTADVSLVETYLQHSCLVLLLLQILVSNTAEILRLSRSAWPVKGDRNKLGGAGFIERGRLQK